MLGQKQYTLEFGDICLGNKVVGLSAVVDVLNTQPDLIGIMAKTRYSFEYLDSGWLIAVDNTCVAEQLTYDELIAFLIDYDINENM